MDSDTRLKLDEMNKKHFGFKWPDSMRWDNLAMGKLQRMLQKKLKWTPALNEARSVLEKSGPPKWLLEITPGGAHSTQVQSGEVSVQGLLQTLRRHEMLCLGYAHAVAPDWDKVDLTIVLEYHACIREKRRKGSLGNEPTSSS